MYLCGIRAEMPAVTCIIQPDRLFFIYHGIYFFPQIIIKAG